MMLVKKVSRLPFTSLYERMEVEIWINKVVALIIIVIPIHVHVTNILVHSEQLKPMTLIATLLGRHRHVVYANMDIYIQFRP